MAFQSFHPRYNSTRNSSRDRGDIAPIAGESSTASHLDGGAAVLARFSRSPVEMDGEAEGAAQRDAFRVEAGPRRAAPPPSHGHDGVSRVPGAPSDMRAERSGYPLAHSSGAGMKKKTRTGGKDKDLPGAIYLGNSQQQRVRTDNNRFGFDKDTIATFERLQIRDNAK